MKQFKLLIYYCFQSDLDDTDFIDSLNLVTERLYIHPAQADYRNEISSIPINIIKLADALISRVFDNYDNFLEQSNNLEYIGVGHTDISDYSKANSKVTINNIVDYCTNSVAELSMTMLLNICRGIDEERINLENYKHWNHYKGTEVYGKSIGIIGAGHIGRRMAHLSKAMGLNVKYWSRKKCDELERANIHHVDLNTILLESDIISIHLSLNDQTRGFFQTEHFLKLKPHSIILNPSKPEIFDLEQFDLILPKVKAVFWFDEMHDIKQRKKYLGKPNIKLTRGLGWYTKEAQAKAKKLMLENIRNYLITN